MAGLFDRISKAATDAAVLAGNKAGELMEVGKLKSKINSEKQDIGLAMKEIGEHYYSLYEEGKVDDEIVKELCERIKGCYEQIADLEKQIQLAKDEYEAKTGREAAESDAAE